MLNRKWSVWVNFQSNTVSRVQFCTKRQFWWIVNQKWSFRVNFKLKIVTFAEFSFWLNFGINFEFKVIIKGIIGNFEQIFNEKWSFLEVIL